MTPRRVGILGGMGPQATVELMQRIIRAVPAQDDADHIPLIVDQNPQVPSRIRHLVEGTGEDPGPVLAAMAQRLEAAGAEALAMPCNTAHHYAGAIREAATVPLIDMIDLSMSRAADLIGTDGSLGILASPAVRRTGLFDRALATVGLTATYPGDETLLKETILRIKAEGVSPKARADLTTLSSDLMARGATVQMLACTEFSLIADATDPRATTFDTLDLLVDGVIAFALSRDTA